MKRLLLRYVVSLVVIVLLIAAATLAGGFFWAESVIRRHYSPLINPVSGALADILSQKSIHRSDIQRSLERLTRQGDVVMWAVSHENGDVVYARGPQKREQIIWPVRLTFPLISGGKRIGWLKVWPSPEFIFWEILRYDNLVRILVAVLAAGIVMVALLFFYFWRTFLVPLRKIDEFIDLLDRDENAALDFDIGNREWRRLSGRLNRLTEKIADTTTTLAMLFSVSQTLTSHTEVNDVFNVITGIIHKKFGDVPCALLLMGDDGSLRIRSQRGLSPEFVRAVRFRSGEGAAGRAFQQCQPVVVNDCAGEEFCCNGMPDAAGGICSVAHVPLLIDGKCVGTLSVLSKEKDFFVPPKVKTLTTLGKYLSIALRNARLYEDVQDLNRRLKTEVSSTTSELLQTNSRLIQKVREMKVLSDIASFSASKVNLSEILEMIVDKIKELLQTQSAGFFLYSEETRHITPYPPFFGIKDHDFSKLHFKIEEVPLLENVIREGKCCVINSGEEMPALPLLANIITLHSLILVPLRSGKKSIGVLGVANKLDAPFGPDDARILELIADRISGIIENVRLYQELELRLRDLTTLHEISSAISSEPVWEQTLKKIVAATTRAFEADLCALLFYDEANKELVTQPGAYFTGGDEAVLLRIPVDDPNSVSAQVFRSGEAFLSPDASIDLRIKSQTAKLWDVRSLILVPLRAENRLIGALRIGRHKANCYNEEHLRLATLIAHQSAIIIENAHLYDSLRETKSELEELNKIKNEFISMVSHELRTPLTAIKGFVKVVLEGEAGELQQQQKKFLQIADQSIDRLTVLVSDLLDISRIESGQFKLRLAPIDPGGIISDVLKNMAPEISRRRLQLETRLPERFPLIMADRERLIQVFSNLMLNSIKFTPADGRIVIAVQDKGDFVIFTVEDTGIGIASKDHEKIFEKFYQVDSGPTRSSNGTGLGLAIVKSIVEMHGGQVWVESEPGHGSRFHFIIPRAKTEIKDFRRELAQDADGSPDAQN